MDEDQLNNMYPEQYGVKGNDEALTEKEGL